MNYRLLFLFCALVAVFSATAKGIDAPKEEQEKGRLLRLYSFGTSAYSFTDSCELAASKKYGFRSVEKAGCVMRPGQARRWDRHNEKVHRKLDKRNGSGWWDKYIAEASDCSNKK
jgi:hypothetical protein